MSVWSSTVRGLLSSVVSFQKVSIKAYGITESRKGLDADHADQNEETL